MCSIPGTLIIIIIFHPGVTCNREDRLSKSTEDLIRTIPLSKDCCFFEKNESIQLDCNVRNPCSKRACGTLQQIIESIPELKFKNIGSFPADFIPNLPKFSFAIINTASRKEVGEHWILIARLNRNTTMRILWLDH